jgi:phosphatidylserine/phosphatidylglycerophosphate/cardiolipin synthase-like enzyme
MDTRSERYNTELGVLMESRTLAAEFLDLIHFEGSAYRLRLAGADHHIEWVAGQGSSEKVLLDEPEAGAWLQLKARVLGTFVPEGWL